MGIKSFNKANPSVKQIEVYNDFSGGLNVEQADSAINDNQFRKIINFDIDKAGTLVKRPGLYRLPHIEELLNKKVNEVINNRWITDNGNAPSIATLSIKDTVSFFDGRHWVFNYLTTWGTFTICLDKNMNVMDDVDSSEGETVLNTYVWFYKDKDDLTRDANNYITKISKYNDTFVMLKSFYSKITVGKLDKKQIKLYSWNPIKKEIDGTKYKPQWIEASESLNDADLLSLTDYGDSELKQIQSISANDIANKVNAYFELVDYKKKSRELGNLPTDKQFRIYTKETPLAVQVVLEYDNRVVDELTLTHFDKTNILPPEVAHIAFKDANTLVVYLNTYLKGINNRTNGIAKFAHGNFDKLVFFEISVNTNTKKLVINESKIKSALSLTQSGNTHLSQLAGLRKSVGVPNPSNPNFTKYVGYWDEEQNETYIKPGYNTNPFRIKNLAVAKREGINRAQRIIYTSKGTPLNWDVDVMFDNKVGEYYPTVGSNKLISTDGFNIPTAILQSTLSKFVPNDRIMNVNMIAYDLFGSIQLTSTIKGKFETVHPKRTMYLLFNSYYSDTNLTNWRNKSFIEKSTISANHKDFYYTGGASYGLIGALRVTYARSPMRIEDENYCVNSVLQYGIDRTYENEMLNEDTFGFANSSWEIKYKDNVNGVLKSAIVKSCYIENDTFYLENITQANAKRLLKLNNIEINDIEWFNIEDIFGPTSRDEIIKLQNEYINGRVTDLNIKATFTLNGFQKAIQLPLKEYQYFDFLSNILNKKSIGVSINKVNGKTNEMYLYWKNDTQVELLLAINANTFDGLVGNEDEVFSTTKFFISYEYLPNGFIGQVLSFKQQRYLKPNLNDLTYLWYNFINMSALNNKTHPNIYDTTIHKNISHKLIQYPTSTYDGSKVIELFGIRPVNDVILQPGTQRFQVFYNMGSANQQEKANKLIAAITAMSVEDYTAMINSEDYSTTGYKGAGETSTKEAIKGPNWKPFTEVFTSFDDDQSVDNWNQSVEDNKKGKLACFDLTIPSTTTAYMVMIQVAEKDEDASTQVKKPVPKLATVVETKIQFQPSVSAITKENFTGLFDEFSATTHLSTYTSHLIAYGNSNKIFFSDTLTPSYFPYSRVIMLETPESIQACNIFQNKLIISTNNSRYYIGGSSFDSEADPFQLKVISTDSGLYAPKSEVPMGNYLYFLDSSGIKILKNLYGTADKEFSYETIDTPIKSLVPRETNACAVAYRDKYYICFPASRLILVYNFQYKCWVSYTSDYFNFSNMFVNDDRLFGIDRETFAIFEFRNDVYVDNWNETIGFEKDETGNGNVLVQKGTAIECYLETKGLDQSYVPHRKKYDYVLINATIEGIEVLDEANNLITQKALGYLTPYVQVDDDLINYKFSTYKDNADTYHYQVDDPDGLLLIDDSTIGETAILDKSTLGENQYSYYHLPIARTGNRITLGIKYDRPTNFLLHSISLKYSLRNIKFNRSKN